MYKIPNKKEQPGHAVTSLRGELEKIVTISAFICSGCMFMSGGLGYWLGKQEAKKIKFQEKICPCVQKITTQKISDGKQFSCMERR